MGGFAIIGLVNRLVSILVAMVAVSFSGCNTGTAPPKIGTVAPDFTVQDVDRKVTLSGLRGKTVVLNFWASWCGPCIAETPSLVAMSRKMRDHNVVVLAVSIDEDDSAYHKFIKDQGMDMLTVLGKQFHASQQLVRVRANRNPNEIIEKEMTFGERIADRVAGFGGSWTFILTFLTVLVIYTAVNIILGRSAWDPYPFILLNLFLSMLAAIQAPVIMMSQNRQDTKDRLRSELDFDVNRRAESEIQGLARKLNLIGDKINDVEDLLRSKAT